ncbi:guanine nucleotide-releasing factor 2-like isoform X2 [Drosophila novamexicana]|uniref:guanine nucleotide-releasing factor 2-like isoform X2 n=1 Tax=Drosophila novamexicana TaxID=47314 RepID=UPI0011E59139|nr:guanine nucleotide-releasing factor 2-like isoform X2 [Drosophila novamexicana]
MGNLILFSFKFLNSEQLLALGSNCPSPELAPALPPKTQQRTTLSLFDAAMDMLDDCIFEMPEMRQLSPHHQHHSSSTQLHHRHLEKPPPLPRNKKHILAYMEICSANSHSVEQHRHTMHAYNISRNMSHSQTMNIMSVSKDLSPEQEMSGSASTAIPAAIITTPPTSPHTHTHTLN